LFTHVLNPALAFAQFFVARPFLVLVSVLGFVLSSQSFAHSLKVFADFEGHNKVSGSVYFSRGVPARNAKVELFALSDKDEKTLLLNSRTDQDGRFTFDDVSAAKLMISANSGDGHVGRYTFNTKAHSHSNYHAHSNDHAHSTDHTHPNDHDHNHDQKDHSHGLPSALEKTITPVETLAVDNAEQSSIDMKALKLMVEDVVAAQVLPLREELHKAQHDARFSDVVGGIGFIFGIAGIVLWGRAKKESASHKQLNEETDV